MIDLHTHTCFSDGADEPETLLNLAKEVGLSVLSITDHNSVAAYRTQAVKAYPGRLIPGVEITCMYQGEVVEVLGYNFSLEAMEDELSRHVLTFEEKQKREFELICAAFAKAGATFDRDQVIFDPKKESSRKAFLHHLRADPSNRRLFGSEAAWENSRAFARQEVYNPDSQLYVDQSPLYPDLKTAVQMIHRSGGLAFLAHLYIYGNAKQFREQLSEIVETISLDGIECAHSAFSPEQIADLEGFCNEHNLLKSGGSDYHGSRKPDYALGTGRGQLCISEAYLEDWTIKTP